MAKKRANGEGSVNKRSDGRWQASITLGRNEQGKPKRVTYYGRTRKEASEKLKAALSDQPKGTFIVPTQDTLSVYIDSWLAGKKVSIAKNTYNKYCQHKFAYSYLIFTYKLVCTFVLFFQFCQTKHIH